METPDATTPQANAHMGGNHVIGLSNSRTAEAAGYDRARVNMNTPGNGADANGYNKMAKRPGLAARRSSPIPHAWRFIRTTRETVGLNKLPDMIRHHGARLPRRLATQMQDGFNSLHFDAGAREFETPRSNARHQPSHDGAQPVGHPP